MVARGGQLMVLGRLVTMFVVGGWVLRKIVDGV
jgi:hypothetical protein